MNLVTGSSGFLGSAVLQKMESRGMAIIKLGRNPINDICCDLSKEIPRLVSNLQINSVFHLAGKAHSLPKTEIEKQEFFDVNDKGTQHLLSSLESLHHLPKQLVFISTVAVYNREEGENITVNDINPSDF